MRKIVNFGQFLLESTDIDLNAAADEIHPIDYDIVTISDEELTPEKLEEILDAIFSMEESDDRIRLISKLRKDHPKIVEDPLFRTTYFNRVRNWRKY